MYNKVALKTGVGSLTSGYGHILQDLLCEAATFQSGCSNSGIMPPALQHTELTETKFSLSVTHTREDAPDIALLMARRSSGSESKVASSSYAMLSPTTT